MIYWPKNSWMVCFLQLLGFSLFNFENQNSYSTFFNLMTKQSHKYTKEVVMQSSYDIMTGFERSLMQEKNKSLLFSKQDIAKKIRRSWRFHIKSNTAKPKWKMVLNVVTWALAFTRKTWLSNICSFIYCWPLTWNVQQNIAL